LRIASARRWKPRSRQSTCAKLDIAGCEPKSAPQAEFADIIKSDVALWAKIVKEAGITAD
jgi:tripartite-type tricarboxylate transporter receptor subunit TctC